MHLSALYEGNTSPLEPEDIPFSYTYYLWRKLMKADYYPNLNTPLRVILEDLEFDAIETEIRKLKEKK